MLFESLMVWGHGSMMGNMGKGHGLGGVVGVLIAVIVLILFIKMVVGLTILARDRSKRQQEEGRKQSKNKKRQADYKAAGLSDSDIIVFRETLAEAKTNIVTWEAAAKRNTDLGLIEDLTGGLDAAKKIFQHIVENPQQLTRRNDFLYKKLPNIVKLTEKLEAMQREAVKSDQDISETLLLLKTLSAVIAKDYHEILMEDVKIIGNEVQREE